MQRHTYTAPRFDHAIARVKSELGEDAVILEAREIPSGRAGGGVRVELTAVRSADASALGLDAAGASRALARELRWQDVPPRLAERLARDVCVARGGVPPSLCDTEVELGRAIGEELAFEGAAGAGARVVALVGPTGVGKTTTIAKLACDAALARGRQVALVSVDDYRVGGAEQLERFADLIGIPMEVAHDGRSLEIALRRLERADLVFIDTAGRSPRDRVAISKMAACLRSAQERVEVHLCLPSAMRSLEIEDALSTWSVTTPARLTCTKLDEALCHGSVLAAQVHSGLPLAYLTTGQRVPEDIEVATPERLARLLCSRGVPR